MGLETWSVGLGLLRLLRPCWDGLDWISLVVTIARATSDYFISPWFMDSVFNVLTQIENIHPRIVRISNAKSVCIAEQPKYRETMGDVRRACSLCYLNIGEGSRSLQKT